MSKNRDRKLAKLYRRETRLNRHWTEARTS